MACTAIPKRITSIAHGANGFIEPFGGSINETVDFAEVRPGVRKAACIYVRGYSCKAEAEWGVFETPVVRGTSASLVFTLQQVGEVSATTVTLTNARAGAASFDMSSDPVYKQKQEFMHDSGDTDDLAPISIG